MPSASDYRLISVVGGNGRAMVQVSPAWLKILRHHAYSTTTDGVSLWKAFEKPVTLSDLSVSQCRNYLRSNLGIADCDDYVVVGDLPGEKYIVTNTVLPDTTKLTDMSLVDALKEFHKEKPVVLPSAKSFYDNASGYPKNYAFNLPARGIQGVKLDGGSSLLPGEWNKKGDIFVPKTSGHKQAISTPTVGPKVVPIIPPVTPKVAVAPPKQEVEPLSVGFARSPMELVADYLLGEELSDTPENRMALDSAIRLLTLKQRAFAIESEMVVLPCID